MGKSTIGQIICVIVLVVFIGFSFFGEEATPKTADEIGKAVTETVSTKGLEAFGNEKLSSRLGIDSAELEGFVYYGSEDVMDVREILIIKGGEKTDLDNVRDVIVKKAEEKYNTYKDYDPVASALLKNRVIEISKGAIIYIVHDDAAAGLESFLRFVEE